MKFLQNESMRKKIRDVKSYAVYYGYDGGEQLEKYDLAILEPDGQSKENLSKLKSKGTIVIAYVSIMEIHKKSPHFNLLRDEDFLRVDGKLIINKEYDTILTNIGARRWSDILIHKVANLILNEGYDGIFLDTIGDIEYQCIPKELKNIIISGVINFIKNVRKYCGECIIIQNNGLNYLYKYTSELIDGICWENPELSNLEDTKCNEAIFKILSDLNEKKGIKVFILFEKTYVLDFYGEYGESIKLNLEKVFKAMDTVLYIAPTNYLKLK